MTGTITFRRKATDRVMKWVFTLCAFLVVLPLFLIFFDLVIKGAKELRWTLLVDLPHPVGEPGGGIANGILGTILITLLTMAWSVPVAVLSGIYLAEYGTGRLASAVRFAVDTLTGVPSIIMGLFVYTLMVVPLGHFSGYAGGVSLALLITPVVARTTEDMLRLVPNTLREAALGLGAPRWRMIAGVLFPSAKAGLITGVMLALARVSGETAPLLFTALNSPYWPESLGKPTANLTTTIFAFAMSPYPRWQTRAWGAALLITLAVLLITVAARTILKGKKP